MFLKHHCQYDEKNIFTCIQQIENKTNNLMSCCLITVHLTKGDLKYG